MKSYPVYPVCRDNVPVISYSHVETIGLTYQNPRQVYVKRVIQDQVHILSSVADNCPGLRFCCSQTLKTDFLTLRPIYHRLKKNTLELYFYNVKTVRFCDIYCCCILQFLYPPQTLFVVGYTVFTLSVRPSVTFCFLNNLKSNCWIFIKLCKNIHICKTSTLNKKVRARGQFY